MKKADLEKNKAMKIVGQMQQAKGPSRFGEGAAAVPDKREQRRRDQALGLIPFAVKLDHALVKDIQALAQTRGVPLNDLVGELLRKGLGAPAGS